MNTTSRIETLLKENLQPARLEIVDDSASHAGHAGARETGGGHFYATIVSDVFEGKSLVQRHQLVYRVLGDLLRTEIHALGINALTTIEYHQKEIQE